MEFKPKKEYVAKLLSEEEIKFIIPPYQRPYRWERDECETLWDDIISVFEKQNQAKDDEEYFLGSIVAFHNEGQKVFEIIDGQQRLTTFTLLFRAFYECFKSENTKGDYPRDFGKCVWEYERDEGLIFAKRHLDSQVATDSDLGTLAHILSENLSEENLKKSDALYAKNYMYFFEQLQNLKKLKTMDWKAFCDFMLGKKLFVLFIVCDSQESAMTIFNTLNSRGMPLSNADILKGYIYKSKQNEESKNRFANQWKDLETKVDNKESKIDDLNFIFMQYMNIIRAINDDSATTISGVLDFFTKEKDKHYGAIDKWLYKDETMPFLSNLADFWNAPQDFLNDKALQYMDILQSFPNNAWNSFVSCIVWNNRDYFEDEAFDKDSFSQDFVKFLPDIVCFLALAFLNNRTETKLIYSIIFKCNANYLHKRDLNENQVDKNTMPLFESFYTMFKKTDTRRIKFLLRLDAYLYSNFEKLLESKKIEVEHILPTQWQNANFDDWDEETHKIYLEQVGNKILCEKRLNTKCSNNFFAKKQETYKGSIFKELRDLGARDKHTWDRSDIEQRNREIYERLNRFLNKK